ncbi:MAG: purine-binding chemotaxis protein CheW [Magnetococcales bacterium]|nr:purine-binding chemotaxis protein CheW [Magnetococcales bacterium]
MNGITLNQIVTQPTTVRQTVIELDDPLVKLVIFELAGQWFALHGHKVREILARARVFFIPGCPPSLEGVVNVRGDMETVIRLHGLLQLPEQEPGQAAAILLGQGAEIRSGIRVDRVLDVLDLPESAIQPLPTSLPAHWHTLALGVLRYREVPVTLLDLDAILTQYARGLG